MKWTSRILIALWLFVFTAPLGALVAGGCRRHAFEKATPTPQLSALGLQEGETRKREVATYEAHKEAGWSEFFKGFWTVCGCGIVVGVALAVFSFRVGRRASALWLLAALPLYVLVGYMCLIGYAFRFG
jgi:hypothetical protein